MMAGTDTPAQRSFHGAVANTLKFAVIVALYGGASALGISISQIHPTASPFSPASGIALVAVLLLGYRIWPAILAGAFLVNASVPESMTSTGLVLLKSLAIAAGNTLEAVVGAWLVMRYAGGQRAFDRVPTVFRFTALAGMASPAISASVGVLTLAAFGLLPDVSPGLLWFTWWLGDASGVLVVTPLILIWFTRALPHLTRRQLLEVLVLMVLVVCITSVVFSGWFIPGSRGLPLAFLVIPFVVWAALRFGARAVSAIICVMTAIAVGGTLSGFGPFATPNENTSLLILQSFLGVATVTALALAAAVKEQKSADSALHREQMQWKEFAETAPEGLHWLGPDGNLLWANQAELDILGYSREEYIGQPLAKFFRERAQGEAVVERLRNGEALRNVACVLRARDGSTRHVLLSSSAHRENGRVTQARCFLRDITRQKRSELRLETFSNLGHRLSTARTQMEAARVILEAADTLLGWDACLFDLCSPGDSFITPVLSIDTIDGRRVEVPAAERSTRLSATIVKALESGGELILRDVPAFPPDGVAFGDTSRPSASLMYVPVRQQGTLVGFLSIQSYRIGAYTQDDLRTLQALADHCAGALERIRAEEEIRRLNRELRLHVEELQTLFDVAPVGIAVAHDPECCVITGNPAFDAILEIAPGANASKSGDQAELLPYKVMIDGREVLPEHLPMQQAARTNMTLRGLECDLVFNDGHVRNLYQYASPLYTEAGEVRGCVGVFVDITERKRAERALRDTNERLRLALAASNMGTWTRELREGDRLFWSPELEAIFGLKPGEFAGTEQALFEFIHPEDCESIRRAVSRAIAGRTDYEVEFRFMPRDRAMGWMLGRGRAYYDEQGRPVRLAGVGIDITERKETEEALREKRQQWQLITDALPVLIAHVDADERFRFSNRAYENWFSIPNERITGRTVREVVGEELYERLYPRIHAALAGGEQSFEEVFPRAGADPRPVHVHYIPDFNAAGVVQGMHVLMTDISAHRRAEEQIRQLNATLERRVAERTAQWEIANKELEAFCYSVSHDLRAPLRTIRGFSEVVLEQYAGQVDSRGQEYLRRACDAACQMDQLIDDLLKLSRVSRSELRRQEVNLSMLADAIAAELRRCEPERSVEFAITPDLRAHGDERLLRLVMENLLRNAWKFTGKRSRARIAFERAPEAEHAFAIRDNGAGFDMTYADKLFGVFQRLHSTSEFPGTGVGLAIVQRIINRHGGRAWATGEIDRGATFYFTLPAATDF